MAPPRIYPRALRTHYPIVTAGVLSKFSTVGREKRLGLLQHGRSLARANWLSSEESATIRKIGITIANGRAGSRYV